MKDEWLSLIRTFITGRKYSCEKYDQVPVPNLSGKLKLITSAVQREYW